MMTVAQAVNKYGSTYDAKHALASDANFHGFHAERMLDKALEYEGRIKTEPEFADRNKKFVELWFKKALEAETKWYELGGRPHMMTTIDGKRIPLH